MPYRLLYSHWLTEWVEKLDPKAPDELIILARGRHGSCGAWWLRRAGTRDQQPHRRPVCGLGLSSLATHNLTLCSGRNMESWRLSEIKRDDYSPNSAGARQWEVDRRKAQATRLTDVMRAAGVLARAEGCWCLARRGGLEINALGGTSQRHDSEPALSWVNQGGREGGREGGRARGNL